MRIIEMKIISCTDRQVARWRGRKRKMTIRKCNYIRIAGSTTCRDGEKATPREGRAGGPATAPSRRPVSRPVLVADARRLRTETNFNIDNAVATYTRELGNSWKHRSVAVVVGRRRAVPLIIVKYTERIDTHARVTRAGCSV